MRRSFVMMLALGMLSVGTAEARKPKRRQSKRHATKRKAKRRVKRKVKKDAGPFAAGKSNLSLIAGGSNQAIVLGGGFGYYVVDGLELGFQGSYIFAQRDGVEDLAQLSPSVTYTAWQPRSVKPYFGGFLTHNIVGELSWTSVGARGGVAIRTGSGIIRAGVAYESSLDCAQTNDARYECEGIVPEIGFLITL